jgi:hypothetical protein
MTILSVVKDVCGFVGVHVPTTLFGSVTDPRTQLELRGVANEMAQRIAYDSREWRALMETVTFTGDGASERFPLPANYKRMLLNSNVWRSTSAVQPMMFISSADEWLQRRLRGYNYAWGEWIIFADMHIHPVLDGGGVPWHNLYNYLVGYVVYDPDDRTVWRVAIAHTSAATGLFAQDRADRPTLWVATGAVSVPTTAQFNYLSKDCVNLYSGGRGDAFQNDNDTFVLDERLLKLGMIWQWKALKGSPYAEDMATFMDALTRASGADKPSPTLIHRMPSSVSVAYPYPTPTAANWSWPLY